ncbi:MAG: S9 family peptidase, partial [Gemmatimonadota bacterium]|nr:S9 family peptidase [Gemmatimonadota bacterium]
MARTPSHVRVAALVLAPFAWLAPLAAQQPLTPDDWGQWERLGRGVMSPDGSWLAVSIARVNEENELRIRPVADPDSVVVVPYGGGPEFSSDGRWLAYSIGMSDEEREELQERNEPARADLGLLDLGTGEVEEVEDVSSYAFSADGAYLAMRRFAPDGEREATGVDLIVRDLARGTDLNFGNVAEYAWQDGDDAPARLALLIDARDMAGNGVQLYEASEGRIRTLDAASARYSELRWREDAADLALLRTVPDDAEGEEAWADTARVMLAFTDVSRPDVAPRVFD